MLCSELMKRNVERCLDTALVSEAALTMRDKHIGFVPITTADGVTVGTLTDRDIVIRVLAERRPPEETAVSLVMTTPVISCKPDDDLTVAEDLMMRHKKSRILCLDDEGRIAGVISLSTIAKATPEPRIGSVASSIAEREAGGDRESSIEPRTARCRDVMKTVVRCCKRTDRVPEIAALMRDENVGFLPVCEDDGAIAGTITDRDLTVRVVADRRYPITAVAEHLLTPELVCCAPDDPLSVAEDLMVEYRKSRIVCADALRRPLGVISLSDIANVERAGRVIRVLREVTSRPAAALG